MTTDRTVTHLEGTDFQKSRAFSPGIVTQGGKIVWLAGQTALTDLDGKSIAHDFEAQDRTCFALIDRTLNRVGGKLADLVTMKNLAISVFASLAIAAQPALVSKTFSKDIAPRIETIPIQTLTISDEQFLKGDASGRPTTISGILRVAQGSGRLPLVILMHGSGGIEENAVVWERLFASLGISTFNIDSFTGRGIVSTVADQSQLGRLNMILDLYRSLAILAAHPRVDPNRIAVMGFSRGGQAALYATLKRFQKMWNPSGIDPAAYIALYAPCITTYIGDTQVTDHPIRIFHGRSDDWVEIAPCRAYFKRLRVTAKDVQMTEYPNTWHAFDYLSLPSKPIIVPYAQTTHCVLKEEPMGTIINVATHKPFTYADDCLGRNAHVAYSAKATRATEEAVRVLLKTAFKLP
jgi:dienelactone hydrolase/enamine deaminase RidA (YjgF/YER057c/UK114 family)